MSQVGTPPPGDTLSLPLLYLDDILLVVDKPPGQPVHPSAGHPRGTLIQELRAQFKPLGKDVKLAHRIDRETSGIVVATCTDETNDYMHTQFREHLAKKIYLALVEGHLDPPDGEINVPLALARDSRLKVRMEVRSDGAQSRTRYRTAAVLPLHSLVQVWPLTGRQHQIRAHLAHLGHPLVGDKVYGPDEQYFLDNLQGRLSEQARARLGMDRHALHAYQLSFRHPWWGDPLEITAPLPPDMLGFMARVRDTELFAPPWSLSG